MADGAGSNRTQRLLAFVISTPGARSGEITAHLAACEPKRPGLRLEQAVVAQLSQQVSNGKLRRTGERMHYRYWPTKTTQLDLRRFDRDGKARTKSVDARTPKAKAEAKPKPSPTPKATFTREAPPPFRIKKCRVASAIASTGDVSADVSAFIAAGGKVQKLDRHEASQGLRFDHTQTFLPAKRRPVMRARKTSTQ